MTRRPPKQFSPSSASALNPLDYEIMAEKAASLGRAGDAAAAALERLRAHGESGPERRRLLGEAARAVHAYFIQRELCGLRRHDGVIRELAIPREVIVRLGAS